MDIVFQNLEKGGFLISDMVLQEFKNSEITSLLKSRYPNSIIPSIKEIQNLQKELSKKYPFFVNPHKQRNQADLFVIAMAKFYNLAVLTNEITTIKNIQNIQKMPDSAVKKIPEVCLKENIKCYDLISYLAMLI